MGQDLATVLIIFAVLSDGSITEESWWLGTNPANGIGGLNRHSTVESDISPNREDFYNGCGDNHHVSSRMFERNVRIVSARPTKQFDIPAMAQHFSAQADFAKTYNPTLYYFPFPLIVSIVAYNFYPRFFANGTNELGGVANYESISSIIGAKYDKKSGHFEYVPETWPSNWYRVSTTKTSILAPTDAVRSELSLTLLSKHCSRVSRWCIQPTQSCRQVSSRSPAINSTSPTSLAIFTRVL